jgi:hypothetical protein
MAKLITLLAVCLVSAVLLVSCSSTSDPVSASSDPTVDSTSPADGATDVGLIDRVEVMFSEAMDPATVRDTSLVVTARGIEGFVEYDDSSHAAIFTPDTLYTAGAWYDVFVSGGISDLEGNALGHAETLSFQAGTLDCAHMQDYAEPNDAIAQATHVEVGEISHTLSGCDGDTDFFEFTLDDTAYVSARVECKRGVDEWCYGYLRRHTGEDYTHTGKHINTGEHMNVGFTLHPGTYYFEFYGQGGYEDYLLYDFTVTTSDPCDDDAYEDNDFFDEATPVTPGSYTDLQTCYVDRDYFAFQVDAGETIAVTVDAHTGGGATRWIGLYGPSEDELDFYNGDENPVTVEAVAQESGTHYLMTRFWATGYIYDVDIGVTD